MTTELHQAMRDLTVEIQALRHELVRKDVYDADERARTLAITHVGDQVVALAKHVSDLEDKRAADRRLIVSAFLAPFVLLLIQLYIAAQAGGAT